MSAPTGDALLVHEVATASVARADAHLGQVHRPRRVADLASSALLHADNVQAFGLFGQRVDVPGALVLAAHVVSRPDGDADEAALLPSAAGDLPDPAVSVAQLLAGLELPERLLVHVSSVGDTLTAGL